MIKIENLYDVIEEETRKRYGSTDSSDLLKMSPIHLRENIIRGQIFNRIFQIKNDQEDRIRVITPVEDADLIFGEIAEPISRELGVKPSLTYQYYSSKKPVGELLDSNLDNKSKHTVISVLEWNLNKRIEYNIPDNYRSLAPRNVKMLNRGQIDETPKRTEYSCFLSSFHVFNSILSLLQAEDYRNRVEGLIELKEDTVRYLKLNYGIDSNEKYNIWLQDWLNRYDLEITENGIYPKDQAIDREYRTSYYANSHLIPLSQLVNTIHYSCPIDSNESLSFGVIKGKGRRID